MASAPSRLFDYQGVSTLTTPGHIYFIQAKSRTGLIKIGWATKPAERLALIQMLCPIELEILHSMPGNGAEERALHKRFAAHRRHGEWFEPCPELLASIAIFSISHGTDYQPAERAPYVPKGRKPPPVNYGSKKHRAALKKVTTNPLYV